MEEIVNHVDLGKIGATEVSTPYPHIKILDLNKWSAIVIKSLEEGDVPLVGTLKGVTKIVKRISKSAINIDKLIRVTSIQIAFSKEESVPIESTKDYLEEALKWI